MTRNPPLSVWISVALIVAVLFGILKWAGDRSFLEREEALLQTQQERLHDFLSTDKSPRVVMLGTSIAREILPFKEIPGDPPLPWLHISQNGNNFTLFAHLLPTLLQHPPEMLIIQMDILQSDGNSDIQDPPWVDFSTNLRRWREIGMSLKLTKLDRMQQYFREASALQEDIGCYGQGLTWGQVRLAFRIHTQPRLHQSPAISPNVLKSIREMASRGTRIMLMVIPRSQSFEAAFGEEINSWQDAVRTELKDIPHVRIWQLAQPMGDDCYCDFRHLNPARRNVMEPAHKQLASEIRNQLHE